MFTELVRAAFKAEGLSVNWEVLPPLRCNASTSDGSILADFTSVKTFSNSKDAVIFPSPAAVNLDIVAFFDTRKLPNGLEFDTVKSLGKYKIGLLAGTGSIAVFKNAGVNFETILEVETMVKMLDAGRVDAIVLGDLVGLYNLRKLFPESAKAFKYKSVYSSPVDLGFSTKAPNYRTYFDKYQEGMRTIKKNGTYMDIFAKYYGGPSKINKNALAEDMK
jgi:polar amino acid transport system substrate-binding protein